MFCTQGLIFTLILCFVVAEPRPEEQLLEEEAEKTSLQIRADINKIQNMTNLKLQEAEKTKEDIKQIEDKLKQTISSLQERSSNLSADHSEILEQMFILNQTVSDLENNITVEKVKLVNAKDYSYRIRFIIKLLKEENGILSSRRLNGTDKECFEFLANKTSNESSPASGVSTRSLSPANRAVLVLQQQLNQAKYKLHEAESDLSTLKQHHELKKTLLLSQKANLDRLIEEVTNYVAEAEEIVRQFKEDIELKKTELRGLQKEIKEVEEDNKRAVEAVSDAQNQLREFKLDIKCYKKLQRESV